MDTLLKLVTSLLPLSKPLSRKFPLSPLIDKIAVKKNSTRTFLDSYIATGQKKIEETTGDDVKSKASDLQNQASNAAQDASNTASKKADELKQ